MSVFLLSRLWFSVYKDVLTQTFSSCFLALDSFSFSSFQQTIPTRFVKEIVKAADKNHDGFLEKHEFQQFLENIGAKDALTSEELDEIIQEALGDDPKANPKIPIDRVKALLSSEFAKK